MRVTSSRAYSRPPPVPRMPSGLIELMDGLARDVLVHNPSNVYEFCANHMQKLLEIRDGPSSKKLLTLEQKILYAQEKMRQKAQERREKFDKEMKFQPNDVKIDLDNKHNSALEKLSVLGPSLGAPMPFELDLNNASEVEISIVPNVENVPLGEVTNGPNLNNINHAEYFIDNSERIENDNLILEEKHEQEIETENINKLDDEPIFGKVEVSSVDPKQEEIVGITDIDSPLQTITEGSEENFISDSGVILPKITIGEDGRDPDITSDESRQEVHNDTFDESNNEDKTKFSTITIPANNVPNKDTVHESIIPGNNPVVKENVSDLVQNSKKEIDITNQNHTPIEEDEHNDNSGKVSEIMNNHAVDVNSTETISDINNLLVDANSVSYTNVSDETHKTDSPNSSDIILDVEDLHTKDLANESNHEVIPEDKETSLDNVLTENKSVSKTEATHDHSENDVTTENIQSKTGEHVETIKEHEAVSNLKAETELVNMTEANNTDLNLDSDNTVNIETEVLQHKLITDEEKLGAGYEKYLDNADISIQKSDSMENTNEDSISMLESDLSKTDDDLQNNPNMDLETAAVTIQKVFRSLMFKSRDSTFEDTANDEHNSVDEDNDKKEEYYVAANLSKERRPLGITRMDTVLQTVNEEKSLSLSTDDSSTLSSAATTIQAHVRGFLVRNRLNSSKTFSMNSLVNSHEVFEADPEHKSKTILNIHIVPEEGNYLSRDESFITSMDLSLDGSPPSSVNLHPMSCDISERRKMLKREDAVQSVTPPSNNSGKLSEDSVKEVLINENGVLEREPTDDKTDIEDLTKDNEAGDVVSSTSTATPTTVVTISKSEDPVRSPRENMEALQRNGTSLTKLSSDESDVITPFVPSPRSATDGTKLLHSSEFHDVVVLPTKVSRNDTSAVRGE